MDSGLWGFLGAWRALFDRFDADRSGAISLAEYSTALAAFGYSLSPEFVRMMYGLYNRGGARRGSAGGPDGGGGPGGGPGGEDGMSFDLFVQSCIGLKRMTDVFKRYDTDRDGYVTLSFEEFLTGESAAFSCSFCSRGRVCQGSTRGRSASGPRVQLGYGTRWSVQVR